MAVSRLGDCTPIQPKLGLLEDEVKGSHDSMCLWVRDKTSRHSHAAHAHACTDHA